MTDEMKTMAEAPVEVREILPELEGDVEIDPVLDAQEAAMGEEELDEEYIDADDLIELLGQLKEMIEAQSKEIRGLRREMRELRESQGGGFRPREDRGFGDRGGDRGFRPREDRGFGDRGGDRGGFRGNRDGGFRPREDRGERNFGDREFRPREDEGAFRPRARADRGWGNKRTDEE